MVAFVTSIQKATSSINLPSFSLQDEIDLFVYFRCLGACVNNLGSTRMEWICE